MKTMKLGEEIKRVSEKEVDNHLRNGWNYCSKSEWKEKVRVLEKPKTEKKTKKTKKSK